MSVGPLAVQVWDLGGQANLRPSWATYYQHTDSIILVSITVAHRMAAATVSIGSAARSNRGYAPGLQVVDSTDRGRVGIARKELTALLGRQPAALMLAAHSHPCRI
jgi:ADP-ribosylation factor family